MTKKKELPAKNYRKIEVEKKKAEDAYWQSLSGPITITKKAKVQG